MVDSNDRVYLSQYTPDFSYGINITAKWRNWTLLPTAPPHGGIAFNNNSYYLTEAKTSIPKTHGCAGPRDRLDSPLSASDHRHYLNNNQTSTFWRYSTDRLT